MPSKKKVVKGEEELTPTLQGGLPLFTELPRRGLLGNSLGLYIGNDKAPGLFTEGFYRYSVFSTSLDVSNHHLNLLSSLGGSSFALEIAWSLYAFSL